MLPSFTELGTQPFSEGRWPATPGIPLSLPARSWGYTPVLYCSAPRFKYPCLCSRLSLAELSPIYHSIRMTMAIGKAGTFGQCEDIHYVPGIILCWTFRAYGEGAQEMDSKRWVSKWVRQLKVLFRKVLSPWRWQLKTKKPNDIISGENTDRRKMPKAIFFGPFEYLKPKAMYVFRVPPPQAEASLLHNSWSHLFFICSHS